MEPNKDLNQNIPVTLIEPIVNTPPIIEQTQPEVIPPKKKSYTLLIILLVLVILSVLGFAGYTLYKTMYPSTPQQNNTVNNNSQNNQEANNDDKQEEAKTEFVKKLESTFSKGDDYMFFIYDNQKGAGINVVISLFDLKNKKEGLRNEIKLKIANSEFLNKEHAIFDEETGDVYFSTNTIAKTNRGEYCDYPSFPQTADCIVKIFKINFLNDKIEEVYKKKTGYTWVLDKANDRLIVKEQNEKPNQYDYKSVSLADKSIKTLARITGLTKEFSLMLNGQMNIKDNIAYDIFSKYDPDVYSQSKYLRRIDLSTGKWTDELIPFVKSNAIDETILSNDMTKLGFVYSGSGEFEDFKLGAAVYDLKSSKIISTVPSTIDSPVVNVYAYVSNEGALYFTADNGYSYVYDYRKGTNVQIGKGTINALPNSKNYVVLTDGVSTSAKVLLYDLLASESFNLKTYYSDFIPDASGQNLNSFSIRAVK